MANKLGVGFIGSGFVAKFHLQAWRGVRDAAQATATLARDLSAEQERTIAFKPEGLDSYVPLVAQGLWKAR